MIDYESSIRIALKEARILGAETIKIIDAAGRFTAENIYAKVFLPEFNNSAMDGYAVNSRFIQSASAGRPAILRLKGESRAGDVPGKTSVSGLSAVKIFTGAPIPRGADVVVKVEETAPVSMSPPVSITPPVSTPLLAGAPRSEFIKIYKPLKKWENVRFRGENIKPGQMILRKGCRIRPQEIGLLLQAGALTVRVIKQPVAAILATGDELVRPGQRKRPGKIANVNSYTISGEIASAGAVPLDLGIARDDAADIRSKIKLGLAKADVLIVSAGISMGERDYVKKVFSELGVKQLFWKVAQRPGEPLFFGIHSPAGRRYLPRGAARTLVFGIPGNTVSTMVCSKEYIKPALLKMQGAQGARGAADFMPVEINAYLEEPVNVPGERRYFLRGSARLEDGKYFVKTTGEQGSGILKSMVDANCLIIIPENIRALGPGQIVKIQLI